MTKSLRTKPLRMVAIAVLPLALLGTACSSDDDGDSGRHRSIGRRRGAGRRHGRRPRHRATPSGNADVEEFCSQVDEFVDRDGRVLADPTSGDAGALATQGQELAASAHRARRLGRQRPTADRLEECTEKLSEIGS